MERRPLLPEAQVIFDNNARDFASMAAKRLRKNCTQTQTTAGTASQTRYVHKDHLGSIHTLTKEDGSIDEVLSFDAWGRRRTLAFDSTTQSLRYSYGSVTSQTDRGFTGHEMLDAVGLIHMNGRIYDSTIGRFLSVDPVVQEAGNLQNLNRYCYVLNNPLSLTDPSGFFFKGLGHFFAENWKQIVTIAVGAALAFFAPGVFELALQSFWGAVVGGAAGGFGSAFTGTLLSGRSLGDAFRAGITGGAIGAVTAGAIYGGSTELELHGLTEDFQTGKFSYLKEGVRTEISETQFIEKVAEKVAMHGVIGGIAADPQGDKFVHGFLAGGTTGLASPFIAGAHFSESGQVAAAAAVGGTSSQLGGGKFCNGAMTGAFVYLFNQGLTKLNQEPEAATVARTQQDPAAYYKALIAEGGDGAEYAKLALSVVTDPNNMANIYMKNYAFWSGVTVTDEMIHAIQVDLMNAHANALATDQTGTIGLLSSDQIESYHHVVYAKYGLGGMAFGGTFMDRTWPKGEWCPRCDTK